jgi:hypothetical protein
MVSSSPDRPTTPGRSPSSHNNLMPIPENNLSVKETHPPRRSSLGFLRRSKSGEPITARMSKKERALFEKQEQERARAAVPKSPPRLPDFAPRPTIPSFGGEGYRPDSVEILSNKVPGQGAPPNFSRKSMDSQYTQAPGGQVPPMPSHDPYAKTESMAHRGRYSYASSAVSTINSPRRVRRRRDPTPFK